MGDPVSFWDLTPDEGALFECGIVCDGTLRFQHGKAAQPPPPAKSTAVFQLIEDKAAIRLQTSVFLGDRLDKRVQAQAPEWARKLRRCSTCSATPCIHAIAAHASVHFAQRQYLLDSE